MDSFRSLSTRCSFPLESKQVSFILPKVIFKMTLDKISNLKVILQPNMMYSKFLSKTTPNPTHESTNYSLPMILTYTNPKPRLPYTPWSTLNPPYLYFWILRSLSLTSTLPHPQHNEFYPVNKNEICAFETKAQKLGSKDTRIKKMEESTPNSPSKPWKFNPGYVSLFSLQKVPSFHLFFK